MPRCALSLTEEPYIWKFWTISSNFARRSRIRVNLIFIPCHKHESSIRTESERPDINPKEYCRVYVLVFFNFILINQREQMGNNSYPTSNCDDLVSLIFRSLMTFLVALLLSFEWLNGNYVNKMSSQGFQSYSFPFTVFLHGPLGGLWLLSTYCE